MSQQTYFAAGTRGDHAAETPRLALPALVFVSAAAQLTLVIANPILLNIAQAADTHFAMLRALRQVRKPSVILLRRVPRRPAAQEAVLAAQLHGLQVALEAGAIVTLDWSRVRVRRLTPP